MNVIWYTFTHLIYLPICTDDRSVSIPNINEYFDSHATNAFLAMSCSRRILFRELNFFREDREFETLANMKPTAVYTLTKTIGLPQVCCHHHLKQSRDSYVYIGRPLTLHDFLLYVICDRGACVGTWQLFSTVHEFLWKPVHQLFFNMFKTKIFPRFAASPFTTLSYNLL